MDQVQSRGQLFKLLWIRYRAGNNFLNFYGSGIEQGTTFSTSMDQVYSRGHIFKLLWIRYRAGDNFLNCHGSGIKLETTLKLFVRSNSCTRSKRSNTRTKFTGSYRIKICKFYVQKNNCCDYKVRFIYNLKQINRYSFFLVLIITAFSNFLNNVNFVF